MDGQRAPVIRKGRWTLGGAGREGPGADGQEPLSPYRWREGQTDGRGHGDTGGSRSAAGLSPAAAQFRKREPERGGKGRDGSPSGQPDPTSGPGPHSPPGSGQAPGVAVARVWLSARLPGARADGGSVRTRPGRAWWPVRYHPGLGAAGERRGSLK